MKNIALPGANQILPKYIYIQYYKIKTINCLCDENNLKNLAECIARSVLK